MMRNLIKPLELIGLILSIGSISSAALIGSSTCDFNGITIQNDGIVTAYQNSTVPPGEACVSQTRQCVDGVLYGSYAYASCSVAQYSSCLFNGTTVGHGDSITAYSASSVSFGLSCASVAEIRTCSNGVLSGSAPYSSCNTNSPRSCLFNGSTIAHGNSVTAFLTSTTQYGGQCSAETRTCSDGTLSGSYQYGSCNMDQPASCLFDGRTVAHGENVIAFSASSVSYGSTCSQQTRSCNNGILSGSYNFSSCVVGQPASCSLSGQTIISGESVTAYQSSSVLYGGSCVSEARSCLNGTLSGSYTNLSCAVQTPVSCVFNGQTVEDSASVLAYATSSVPYGNKCQNEMRLCSNGTLSGSYLQSTCQVQPAANCSINGVTVIDGNSITLFTTSSVPYGQTCQSEQRTCNNGILSGSATNTNCIIENAPPAKNCSFNGSTVLSGSAATAYQSSSVVYGSSCVSESRVCEDGVLSGSYLNSSCTVQPAMNCSFNGQPVLNGASVIAYNDLCKTEQRLCTNGVLSGTYSNASCPVQPSKDCSFNGKIISDGSSVTAFLQSSVPYGQNCQSEQRLCTNGVLSGSAVNESCIIQPKPPGENCEMRKIIWEFSVRSSSHSCSHKNVFGTMISRVSRDGGKTWVIVNHDNLPEDLKEIYQYLIKKHKVSGHERPRGFMVESKNKGFLLIRPELLPNCNECHFVEIEENHHGHHDCSHHEKNREKHERRHKSVHFSCGQNGENENHHKSKSKK